MFRRNGWILFAVHNQHQTHQWASNPDSVEHGICRPPPPIPPNSHVVPNQREFPSSIGPEGMCPMHLPDKPHERKTSRRTAHKEEIVTSFFPEQQAPIQREHRPPVIQPRQQIAPLTEDEEMPRYKMDARPKGRLVYQT